MRIGMYTNRETGEEEFRITFNPDDKISITQGIAILQFMIANPNYFVSGQWEKFLGVLLQRFSLYDNQPN